MAIATLNSEVDNLSVRQKRDFREYTLKLFDLYTRGKGHVGKPDEQNRPTATPPPLPRRSTDEERTEEAPESAALKVLRTERPVLSSCPVSCVHRSPARDDSTV
jgi:hypothetical protein